MYNRNRDVNALSSRLAAMLVNVICITYYNVLPIVLGGAADAHGLAERELGFVASSFMAGLALVNIAGIFWIRRFNWKRLIIGGNLVATLAFLLPAYYFSAINWMVFNFIAGIATGISYGVSVACLGDSREPDRNFAFAMVGQTVVCAGLIFSLPRLSVGLDMFTAGQYAVALLMLLGMLLVFYIPARGSKSGNKEASKLFPDARMSTALKLALAVLFLNMLAEGAVWAFLERIAVADGHTTRFAATAMAASFLAAGAGSMVAGMMGTRFGRTIPFLTAVSISITSVWLFWLGSSQIAYMVAVLLFAGAWNLGSAYRMALAADADTSGHFSTLIPAMMTLGATMGPALGGLLVVDGSFTYDYMLSTVAWLLTVVLFLKAQAELKTSR